VIPVLIIPILNRPELLDALLASIDYPIGRIVVIDNGNVVGDLPGVHVIHLPHNLGVAAGWNLGMKATPDALWWLISNNDIEFGPGDLARLAEVIDSNASDINYMLDMAVFAITQETLAEVGYFDENFHPAYDEDLDYARRARLVGVKEVQVGFTGKHVGSATIYGDWEYRIQNFRTHSENDRYYAAKWGGPKQGGETFTTPFNTGANIGSWQLDPLRILRQAWITKKGHGS
jgi:GT2 family glycosyltransferase